MISIFLLSLFVAAGFSDINEDLYKKGKQLYGDEGSKLWNEEEDVAKGRKNLYIYRNAYNPDRDGFCERIARQTANLVRTNQYPHLHKSKNKGYHRGRRSTFPRVVDSFQSRSSYPVEYVDYDNFPQEFSANYDEDQNAAFEDVTMKEELGPKGRRGTVLNIDAQDKRPKCQPIGAQIDCRCGISSSRPAGGWCALWKCGGIRSASNPIGRWECASWC